MPAKWDMITTKVDSTNQGYYTDFGSLTIPGLTISTSTHSTGVQEPPKKVEKIDYSALYVSYGPGKKYRPKRIIQNGPATIVFWKDGTKTIVKKSPDSPDDIYYAFCSALAKKMYKTNSALKRSIRDALKREDKK